MPPLHTQTETDILIYIHVYMRGRKHETLLSLKSNKVFPSDNAFEILDSFL